MERYYCNKCNKEYDEITLNELEMKELIKEGSFVCSDCINKEMNKEEYCKCKKEDYKDCEICLKARKYKDKICPECELPILYKQNLKE